MFKINFFLNVYALRRHRSYVALLHRRLFRYQVQRYSKDQLSVVVLETGDVATNPNHTQLTNSRAKSMPKLCRYAATLADTFLYIVNIYALYFDQHLPISISGHYREHFSDLQ